MAEKYEKVLQTLKSRNVKSAQIAVDYLQNDMLSHMNDLVGKAINEAVKRGFRPIYENPTKILIERSAKSYKEAPTRAVALNGEKSDELTRKYNDVLVRTDMNFISQDLDARARLMSAALLLPQVTNEEEETITLNVLSRNNCEVKLNPDTKKIEGLVYTAFNSGPNGGQMYHYWTDEYIQDIEGDKASPKIPNPYGIIPTAVLNDTRPPIGSMWQFPTWEQLIQLSDGVNLFNTEALYNARYGMIGSPVTNMKIADGTVIGIDAPLKLDSTGVEAPFFEFRNPTSNVTEFTTWLNKLKEAVADEWGVNLKFAGGSIADSGFKLVVEEFENIELRQKRIVAAKQFEEDLYTVFATMSDVHGWGLDKSARGVADFKEPGLPVNQSQEWLIAKEQIVLGVLSLEDYWLSQNPDLTPEQIIEKRASYDKFRGVGVASVTPGFDDVGQ